MSDANPCDPDDPVTDQGRANSSPWTEPPVCPIAVPNNTGEIVWIDGKPVFLLGPGIGSAEGGGPDCPPVPPPAVKFVTAAENVGTGTGLYLQTVDGIIELRTLGAGTNISFAIVGNTLVISSSGGLSAVAWDDVTGKPTVFSPSAHAASHTDGTDDIQDATAAQKGLATAAQITKLNGIEAGATADQSAAEILAALLTVDGAGSGLDADLLDGNSSAAFATATHAAQHTNGTDDIQDATAAQKGLATAVQITKLDGIAAGATVGATWGSNITSQPAVVSQVEAEAGVATTERIWTAERVAQAIAALAPSGGHVIEDEGVPLTQRANMNFTGPGVTVTDAGAKTVVAIPGGGAAADVTYDNTTSGLTATDAQDAVDELAGSIGGGSTVSERRYYAILVTLMRPSKIKWELGSFGTFVPAEKIYVKTANLVRFGADANIYNDNLRNHNTPHDFMPVNSGVNVIAHTAGAALSYVTETDVAAVVNPKATYYKMMAHLHRDATVTNYQNRSPNASGGGAEKTGSTPTTITPGTYGSLILEMEGQGYEGDLVGTVSAVDYVPLSLAPKGAMTADGVNDEWGHKWWGRVPLYMPIDDSMDGNTFAWALKCYTAHSTYDSVLNARVVDLPSDWDTDSVEVGSGETGMSNPMNTAADIIVGGVSGAPTRLAAGTARQVLKMNAGGTAQEWAGETVAIQVAASDETTALTTGDGKVIFRAPFAFTLTGVRASVTTAPTGVTLLTIDITESGSTVLSTLLTFDASSKTTVGASTPAVISDSAIADDAEISINIDAVGSTIAGAGLKVTLLGTRP